MTRRIMKNVRATYGAEATVNLGNFENVRPGLTLSADVEEGEDFKDVVRELREVVDSFIEFVVAETKAEHGVG